MTFKKGDFVRIKEGTHDDAMPASRMGHLIEKVHSTIHYSSREPEQTSVWYIFMTNGNKLKFHQMYLEHVE